MYGVEVEDANGYPGVNPGEKSTADFMKVNVPSTLVRPGRSHLGSVVTEIN